MKQLGFHSITTHPISIAKSNEKSVAVSNQGFKQQLQQSVAAVNDRLSVSKHAQLRMNQRNIDINPTTWLKIEEQIKQAKKMGVTDSLVLTKDAALVVSAKNNTVITAMGREEASSQIFTNINGTILID